MSSFPGKRTFPQSPDVMGAFAEARYFGWNRLRSNEEFPVKEHSLNTKSILSTCCAQEALSRWACAFGTYFPDGLSSCRLSPDDGSTIERDRLGHRLWTVNWHAGQKPAGHSLSQRAPREHSANRSWAAGICGSGCAIEWGRIIRDLDPMIPQSGAWRRKIRIPGLVARRSWCSGNRMRGDHQRTSCGIQKNACRPSYVLAIRWPRSRIMGENCARRYAAYTASLH